MNFSLAEYNSVTELSTTVDHFTGKYQLSKVKKSQVTVTPVGIGQEKEITTVAYEDRICPQFLNITSESNANLNLPNPKSSSWYFYYTNSEDSFRKNDSVLDEMIAFHLGMVSFSLNEELKKDKELSEACEHSATNDNKSWTSLSKCRQFPRSFFRIGVQDIKNQSLADKLEDKSIDLFEKKIAYSSAMVKFIKNTNNKNLSVIASNRSAEMVKPSITNLSGAVVYELKCEYEKR